MPPIGRLGQPGYRPVAGELLRMLALAVALSAAIASLDLRGPDPEVPRVVVDEPSEHERGPRGCAAHC
jgi:hypothetical protein